MNIVYKYNVSYLGHDMVRRGYFYGSRNTSWANLYMECLAAIKINIYAEWPLSSVDSVNLSYDFDVLTQETLCRDSKFSIKTNVDTVYWFHIIILLVFDRFLLFLKKNLLALNFSLFYVFLTVCCLSTGRRTAAFGLFAGFLLLWLSWGFDPRRRGSHTVRWTEALGAGKRKVERYQVYSQHLTTWPFSADS